jgi:hypothetical protein
VACLIPEPAKVFRSGETYTAATAGGRNADYPTPGPPTILILHYPDNLVNRNMYVCCGWTCSVARIL